jgi:uncharacterized protein (TIGR03000 family)
MVRRWFSVSAVLAVAVLVVMTDASQSRERRLGRRARRSADSYVSSGPVSNGVYTYDAAGNPLPGSAEQAALAGTESAGRLSFYPPNSEGMRSVLLEVRVPASAEIWIEGAKTMQTGAIRQFISPALEPDREFTYEIKAKWLANGQERTETRNVNVRAGRVVRVDLTRPAMEKLAKPAGTE